MREPNLWSIGCLVLVLVLLLAAGAATALIDPYFHYHGPLPGLEYPLNNQRYQNDGIVRNFDYDALITGTSMTENFKSSEFDALFGVRSVKVSYSGGTLQELTATVEQALEHNEELKLVLFCIDEWMLFADKNMILADGEYPTYLYDDNPFNDVSYLLNKEILFGSTVGVLEYTRDGNKTTSFDDYSSWPGIPVGREAALSQYTRPETVPDAKPLTPELSARMTEALGASLLKLAAQYPGTQFLCYFPPYSILNWDAHDRAGTLERQVDAFEEASRLLLEAENIRLYSFCGDFATITELDNYRDSVHHSQQINSLLLQRMTGEEYRLTKENYRDHWQQVREFYRGYDYDALFE